MSELKSYLLKDSTDQWVIVDAEDLSRAAVIAVERGKMLTGAFTSAQLGTKQARFMAADLKPINHLGYFVQQREPETVPMTRLLVQIVINKNITASKALLKKLLSRHAVVLDIQEEGYIEMEQP